MIKHIVMFKLKDFAEGASKSKNAKKVKDYLKSLKGKIPEIKSMEVGINCVESDSAYDVVLNSEFENKESVEEYQRHPEHLRVAELIKKIRDNIAVVDYEV